MQSRLIYKPTSGGIQANHTQEVTGNSGFNSQNKKNFKMPKSPESNANKRNLPIEPSETPQSGGTGTFANLLLPSIPTSQHQRSNKQIKNYSKLNSNPGPSRESELSKEMNKRALENATHRTAVQIAQSPTKMMQEKIQTSPVQMQNAKFIIGQSGSKESFRIRQGPIMSTNINAN